MRAAHHPQGGRPKTYLEDRHQETPLEMNVIRPTFDDRYIIHRLEILLNFQKPEEESGGDRKAPFCWA